MLPPSPPLRPSSIEEKDDCFTKTESKTKLDAPITEEDEDDWCMDITSIQSFYTVPNPPTKDQTLNPTSVLTQNGPNL